MLIGEVHELLLIMPFFVFLVKELAASGEKEWYFYCPRDRKYRNSARPNRVTGAGFWKATGTDRPIYSSDGTKCIGLKKSLVFYRGRAAKGIKTDWMMHEFRLPSLSDSPKTFSDKNIPANVIEFYVHISCYFCTENLDSNTLFMYTKSLTSYWSRTGLMGNLQDIQENKLDGTKSSFSLLGFFTTGTFGI